MKVFFSEEEIFYDGSQLSERWLFRRFGLEGDAGVAFLGGCDVKPVYMADLEDLSRGNRIYARKMLHFLFEIFSFPPGGCTSLQRLFVVIIKELVEAKTGKKLKREGNDLFFNGRKLNVSVAIPATISSLIHIGLNEDGEGAPVPVTSLSELGIEGKTFAVEALNRIKDEFESLLRDLYKVRTGK